MECGVKVVFHGQIWKMMKLNGNFEAVLMVCSFDGTQQIITIYKKHSNVTGLCILPSQLSSKYYGTGFKKIWKDRDPRRLGGTY